MSERRALLGLDDSLNSALGRAVASSPGRVFLKVGGSDVTFAEFDRDVGRLAAGLRAAGLGAGDRLVVVMRNSLQCVHTWFAANRLGAVWAPINTEFRGAGLQHVVGLADAKIAVCDPDLAGSLAAALSACGIEAQVFASDAPGEAPLERLSALYEREPVQGVSARFHDMSALLFTSGTTGRSKAAILSHRYFLSQAAIAIRGFDLHKEDVLYCPFPLFHADATALTVAPALLLGATAALGQRFSASRFWAEVRAAGATVFDFMGATLSILNKAEPQANDADNPVRLAWGVPVPEWVTGFEKRFDLKVYELYGSVEASIPVIQSHDSPRVAGSCGRTIPEFDVIVADEADEEVVRGSVGEILVRSNVPFTTMTGYFGMPEATAEMTRNFWFHSGDLGRMDDDRNLYFVGRKKEAIRRRGENISAFEVEEGILRHPDIVECAAIGVPSELSEEDVKVFVVLRPGSHLGALEIYQHCKMTLARFQLPRYIEIVDSLPKTPTGKLEKYRLKEQPKGNSEWDSESMLDRNTRS